MNLVEDIPTHMFYISFLLLTVGTVALIIIREKKTQLVINMYNDKLFLLNLVGIAVFSMYNYTKGATNQKATLDAILGFIVAVFSHLDLKSSIFWVIWLVSYYFNT